MYLCVCICNGVNSTQSIPLAMSVVGPISSQGTKQRESPGQSIVSWSPMCLAPPDQWCSAEMWKPRQVGNGWQVDRERKNKNQSYNNITLLERRRVDHHFSQPWLRRSHPISWLTTQHSYLSSYRGGYFNPVKIAMPCEDLAQRGRWWTVARDHHGDWPEMGCVEGHFVPT